MAKPPRRRPSKKRVTTRAELPELSPSESALSRHANGTFAKVKPVVLAEPSVHPREREAETLVEASVVEFVAPDMPHSSITQAELQRDASVPMQNRWLYYIFLFFVFFLICGPLLLAMYEGL